MNQKTSDVYTHSSGQQIRLGDMFTSVSNHANSHGRLYIVNSLSIVRSGKQGAYLLCS